MGIQNNKNLNEIKSEVFVNELEIDNAKSKSSGSEDIESLFRKIFERSLSARLPKNPFLSFVSVFYHRMTTV